MTEIAKMPHRGRSLTIDAAWRDVAEKALEFIKRFTSVSGTAPAAPKRTDGRAA